MKKRILALLMALITACTLLPTLVPTAEAYNPDYFPEKYSKQREECFKILKKVNAGTLKGVKVTFRLGKFTIAAGDDYDYIYYGEMKHGKPNGYGYISGSVRKFVGKFKKGKPAGYGIVLNAGNGLHDGDDIYEANRCKVSIVGKFLASGKGVIYDNINANDLMSNPHIIYEGRLRKNQRHGKGTAYEYKKGSSQVGHGTLLYKGSFKWDKYSGGGKLYYIDGTLKYKGSFWKGMYHGRGTLYNKNGSVKYRGRFRRGNAV